MFSTYLEMTQHSGRWGGGPLCGRGHAGDTVWVCEMQTLPILGFTVKMWYFKQFDDVMKCSGPSSAILCVVLTVRVLLGGF